MTQLPAIERTDASHVIPEVYAARDAAGRDDMLQQALRAIREHLGMQVAFVSEIADGRRRFIHVDSSSVQAPIRVGDSNPVDEGYCQRVVNGQLPELIRDATQIPAALVIPATLALPIGAHLSVPIRLSDGSVYGTFCCFSTTPDYSLTDRDLSMMRVFAGFTALQIERQKEAQRTLNKMTERVSAVLDEGKIGIAYQPIFDFLLNRIVGFEALARFAIAPHRTPDIWFSEANQIGLGEALEMKVIEQALIGLEQLHSGSYLSLNVSSEHIVSGAIENALRSVPLDRIVLEVTEHAVIADYSRFGEMLEPLRLRGLRLAVDDAGAGFASFRHILQLSPDIIKLDMSLIRGIDTDQRRRALAAALIRFAEQTDSKVVAEGIETTAELEVLQHLGVRKAQGYLLGRPMPIADAAALAQRTFTSPANEKPVVRSRLTTGKR